MLVLQVGLLSKLGHLLLCKVGVAFSQNKKIGHAWIQGDVIGLVPVTLTLIKAAHLLYELKFIFLALKLVDMYSVLQLFIKLILPLQFELTHAYNVLKLADLLVLAQDFILLADAVLFPLDLVRVLVHYGDWTCNLARN